MTKENPEQKEDAPPQHVPGSTRGEERALDKDEEERRKDREDVGIDTSPPMSPDMPHTGPADQGS
jgi:hypothetical protein